MTNTNKALALLSFCLLGFLICAVCGWDQEHKAALLVVTQQKTDAATIATLQAKEKANEAQLAKSLDAFAQLKKTVQTPAQIVKALPQVLTLPVPVEQVTAAEAVAADAEKLPDAPKINDGDLIIPQADLKTFYDAQVDCKASEATANSCAVTVADQKAVMAVKDTEITQLQTALKGGTKWQRMKSAGKWTAIGVAIGAVAAEVVIHK